MPPIRTAVVAAALLALCAIAPARADAAEAKPESSVRARLERGGPLIVAHRGCWRKGPENSLAAMRACIAAGVDMVEVDLRRTKDGVIVLLHDDTLDRTSNLTGPLASYTSAELRNGRLRAGQGGADAPLTEERIPTFQEFLATTKGRILVFLDIKEPLHDAAYAEVLRAGVQDQVLFVLREEFDPDLRRRAFAKDAAVMPRICEGCRWIPTVEAAQSLFRDLRPPVYELVFRTDPYLDVELYHAARLGAGVWINALGASRDRPSAWALYARPEVRAIRTDRPEDLKAFLADPEWRRIFAAGEGLGAGPGPTNWIGQ